MRHANGANRRGPTTAAETGLYAKLGMTGILSVEMSLAVVLVVMLFCSIVAAAQTRPKCVSQPLEQPPNITSSDGVSVNSALVMQQQDWYWLVRDDSSNPPTPVPGTRPGLTPPEPCDDTFTLQKSDGTKEILTKPAKVWKQALRTYGYPKDPTKWNDPVYLSKKENINWVIPGTTFHIKPGQNFNLTLYNGLNPEGTHDHQCNPLGKAPPNYDAYPNCFHEDNVSNIHYHGFRVSPSAPQDNVFLTLYPVEDPTKPPTTCAKEGDEATGCYQSHLDTITDIQPIGTHWYHPHKHGATALQVINGMAGAFLIEGYFDAAIRREVSRVATTPAHLDEKVLVLQQIKGELNFLNKGVGNGGEIWVDGQRQPVIAMKPGEIQRWRFVGAVQQLGGFKALQFQGNKMRSRQIAQDGVPFAPDNYIRQPLNIVKATTILNEGLLRADGLQIFQRLRAQATATESETKATYLLAPGNRVDLLVVAPNAPGRYILKYLDVATLAPLPTDEKNIKAGEGDVDTLLIVRVTAGKKGGAVCKNPNTCLQGIKLPPLPAYLNDIDPKPSKQTVVTFSMNPGSPSDANPSGSKVFIDETLYDPGFINHRVSLSQPEQWEIRNTSGVPHPFHIHINPFQVTKIMDTDLPSPWVWWDVFPLPIQQTSTPVGTVTIRQRFLGFTGKYVLHCHILGHEDRGMMQNVLAEQ